jgi:hypothetical protein
MRLTWDELGSHQYETGVDRGVFYPSVGSGVPWNGLVNVKETVENDGTLTTYVDGARIINQLQLGQFGADISAFTYPDELMPYDGYTSPMYSGQHRRRFHLSYRSQIGSDTKDTSYDYRLHLIFNCLLTPTIRENNSLNNNSETLLFEWKLSTIPVALPHNRPTSHFMLDSRDVQPDALAAIENILYGIDGGSNATFPTVQQILDVFEANAIFIVVDNGDGTATITGPDEWVHSVGTDQVFINSPSFNEIDPVHILTTSY